MFLLTAFLAAAPVAAEATPALSTAPPAPQLRALRVTTPPVLDGILDDEVWKLAPRGVSFTQKFPTDGDKASDPTIVRVLYDDDAVYVGFDCRQPHTPVVERLTRRDRNVEVDSVTFALGTRGDHKSAFEFSVNASGTLIDAIRFNDTDYSSDWDENWDARTNVTAEGWTAEFRIPLRVLRFPSLAVQSWDFQASRYISGRQESDQWAYFPRSVGGEVSHYGRLDGLEGLHAGAPLELRPFIVGRVRRRDPAVGQLASGWDALGSAGLDVKWHPTQDLTLDATFNPDFAQVEADQVVLNLSSVETYYPEKRPFFLEGSDAFATPFQLLYTRRIGRVPLLPSLRSGEQLVDVPEPSPIYGAMKLTGSIGKGWSVGTVQAVAAANSVDVQLGSGARVSRVIDPTSTFNLLRLKRDVGDNAHIAFMATAVTHAEQTEAYSLHTSAAELCPNGANLTPLVRTTLNPAPRARCFNDAYVGAVDWRWRSPGGDYVTGGQIAASVLANGPNRPIADGTIIHNGDVGVGGQAYANKEGGKHWTGNLNAILESRALTINDLGYDKRANRIGPSAEIQHKELDPFGPFTETHVYLHLGMTWDWAGLLDGQGLWGQGLYLGSWGRFRNKWNYYTDVHARPATFNDREVGDGTALERAGYVGGEVQINTDGTKRVQVGIDQITDAVEGGFSMNGNAFMSVRMLPQWDVDLLPTWQWAFGEPRFMTNGSPNHGRASYLFGDLDAKSLGLTIRTTYTFLPRLTLQGYAQLFLASGHYSQFTQFLSDPKARPSVRLSQLVPYRGALPTNSDFEQGILNINLVLRWEYMLGSTLFLVYTRSQVPTTSLGATDVGALNFGAVGQAPASDVVLAKISFWWGL